VKILGTEGIENGVYLTGDVMVDALQEKRGMLCSNLLLLFERCPFAFHP